MLYLISWHNRFLIVDSLDSVEDSVICGPATYVDILAYIAEYMPDIDITDWSVPYWTE